MDTSSGIPAATPMACTCERVHDAVINGAPAKVRDCRECGAVTRWLRDLAITFNRDLGESWNGGDVVQYLCEQMTARGIDPDTTGETEASP